MSFRVVQNVGANRSKGVCNFPTSFPLRWWYEVTLHLKRLSGNVDMYANWKVCNVFELPPFARCIGP